MTGLRAAVFGRDIAADGWPTVSVVMPIRNEADHLEHAVDSVLTQQYPVDFDLCLAVAPSDDDTEQIADRLSAANDRVRIVPNPAGSTPAGLNAAIAATDSDIVVRVDGHSALCPGYIRRAVETMIRTGAVNVGGRQVPQPQTPFEDAVAAATSSRLGTGGATYRIGGSEGPVDTVYLGVFDRRAGDAIGWFADDLARNQDYEFNIRSRAAGGLIWFDPDLWVGYRPRGSWTTLTRQYYEYGWWKAEVARRHPGSLRPRQMAAAAAAPAALVSVSMISRSVLVRLAALGYVAAACAGRHLSPRTRAMAGVATATSHLAWSVGFLCGSISGRRPIGRTRTSVTSAT